MVTDMLAAESEWLPQFNGKQPRPAPAIQNIPEDARVSVPVDPALAIANRFGKHATQDTE